LSQLAPGAQAEVQLLNYHPGWGFAWQIGSFGDSTRFEMTCGADEYSWDVSYNAGFDIGMTVVAPEGDDVVCKDDTAPASYQRGTDGCQVQPCSSPSFVRTSGNYKLFLCNRPGDVNTPGPCGCDACPGIPCNEGESDCSTSGGDIWCLTGGPNCPTTTSPAGTTCPSTVAQTLPQFMSSLSPQEGVDPSLPTNITGSADGLAVTLVNNFALQSPCGNPKTLSFFQGYTTVDIPGGGQETAITIPSLFGKYQIGFQTNGWYWAAPDQTPQGNCINPDNAGNVGLEVAADCSTASIVKNFGYTCDDSYVPNASEMVSVKLLSSSPCTVEISNTGNNLPVTDECCSCQTCSGEQIPKDQTVRCW